MVKRILIVVFIAGLATSQALAQTACPLTYRVFEFAVPHLDLEKCPADVARDGVFCRASVGNDAVHVFAFAEKGEQCLLAVKSYNQYQLSVR